MISLEEESQPKDIAKPTNVQTLVSPLRGAQALVKLHTAYERFQVSVCSNVFSKLFIYACQVVFPSQLDMSHQILYYYYYEELTLQNIQIYFPDGVYTR